MVYIDRLTRSRYYLDMQADYWPSDWLRAVLALVVLRVLADGPTWGYAIAASLADQGFGTIKGGTLYPLLARLEEAGYVTTQWRAGDGGPGRKYFEITDSGRAHLTEQGARWSSFAKLADLYITQET